MALATITPAQAELISSLGPEDIPIKLRCAICSKLAVNAFRLPCCEQAICETCQSTLPTSCPVCEHSPVSSADCTPHKSHRTTIRVFLRTVEKKREESRLKESKDSTPATPVDAKPTPQPSVSQEALAEDTSVQSAGVPTEIDASKEELEAQQPTEMPAAESDKAFLDASHPSAEQNAGADESAPGVTEAGPDAAHAVVRAADQHVPEETEQSNEVETDGDQGSQLAEDAGENTNNGMNGGLGNMNYGGNDFNQMQMMMAMQNGMAPNSFGGFPMMGMSNMGMDPMAMQSMYMNGGFGAQGMGMGGFGGGFGSGANNWNGQQAWGFGQDNYNSASAAGMGSGDYGSYNSGFQPGLNQGNYGHHQQFNDYRRGGYGGRVWRGRGRGYFGGMQGRGGYQQYGHYSNYDSMLQQQQHYQGQNATGHASDQSGQQEALESVDEGAQDARPEAPDASAKNEEETAEGTPSGSAAAHDPSGHIAAGGTSHGDLAISDGDALMINSSMMPRGDGFGHNGMAAQPSAPLNAPTGPKAMRQGLPNTSMHHLRARGFQAPNAQKDAHSPANGASLDHAADGHDRPRSRSPKRDRDGDDERDSRREPSRDGERAHDRDHDDRVPDRDPARSRTVSRSRSHDRRSDRHRRKRHRSGEREGDERRGEGDDQDERDERDERRRRKQRSSRRHHNEEDDARSRAKDDGYDDRTRSVSPAESRKSSYRSRRDRDDRRRGKDRDHERDKGGKYRDEEDRDEDGLESSHKSSRRSHRDRDRERDRDRDRDRDRRDRKDREREKDRRRKGGDRDRDRERERDRDRERYREKDRHRGSRKHSPDVAIDDDAKPSSKPSLDRRESTSSGKDPHALEREARDRERLMRETQRMAGLAGLAGLKRGRSGGEGGRGEVDEGDRRGRRKSRRSEAVNHDDEEERMRRLEEEREGSRWG